RSSRRQSHRGFLSARSPIAHTLRHSGISRVLHRRPWRPSRPRRRPSRTLLLPGKKQPKIALFSSQRQPDCPALSPHYSHLPFFISPPVFNSLLVRSVIPATRSLGSFSYSSGVSLCRCS